MKICLFIFSILISFSQLFSQERFEKEWLVGLLSKNLDDKDSAFKSLKHMIESGLSLAEAKSLIMFLSENVEKISNEDIAETFNSLHNPSRPIKDLEFFDSLFKVYPKFSKEIQTCIFHLILHFDHKNTDQQFIRFLEAYGSDLLFLSNQLVSMQIKDPKSVSLKLINFTANENIKFSIYKILTDNFINKKIDAKDFEGLKLKLLEELNLALRKSNDKLKNEKESLVLLLNLSKHLKVELNEKQLKKLFELNDDDIALVTVEVLFIQNKSAPKFFTDKLIKSDLYKIYFFALCEKYQVQTDLIDKSMTQEDIGRGKLMCWFYENLKMKVSANQIVLNDFYEVGLARQWSTPLYKCSLDIPFIKEKLEFAASGGLFKDKNDMSFLDRESIGTEFSLWNSQIAHKHLKDLDYVNGVLDEPLFNIYFWSPQFDELNENNIYQLNEMLKVKFWLKLCKVIAFIQEANGMIVLEGKQKIEIKLDNAGRILGRFPVVEKKGNLVRNGEFKIRSIYEEFEISGHFENGVLNGEVLIKDLYIARGFRLKFNKNILEEFQAFKNNYELTKRTELLIESCLFKKNLLHGPFVFNYESGKKELVGIFEDGQRKGELIRYHENDKVMYKVNFDKGLPKGEVKSYGKNGSVILKIQFSDNWSGQMNTYHASGNVRNQTKFSAGLKNGEERHYFENNKLKLIMPYKDGLMDGHCIFYYENGKLHSTAWFKKNIMEGEAVQYNILGKLIAKAYNENGNPKNGTFFDEEKLTLITYQDFQEMKSEFCDKLGIPLNIEIINEADLKTLSTAILQSDIEKIILFKEKHPSILELNLGNGENSLLVAVKSSKPDLKVVELLVEFNVDVNKQDDEGNTPLHIALFKNDENLFKLLLKNSHLNIQNKAGKTVFEELVNNPNINLNSFLNEKLYQKKHRFDQNLLHLAAKFNQMELIKLCLKNGIDINAKDAFENTALGLAIENKRKEASEYLLSIGANATLFQLVEMGALAKLESELRAKPENLNIKDGMENNLLHQSVKSGQVEVFKYLIAKNLDATSKNYLGLDAISLSIVHNQPLIFEILKMKGFEINEEFGNNQFALYYMTKYGLEDILKMYLEKGFSLNIKSPTEPNLLFVAVINNQEKIVPFLVEKGLNVNEKNQNKESLLQIALQNKNKNMVSLLIKVGAKLNWKEAITLGDLDLLDKLYVDYKKVNNKSIKFNFLHLSVQANQLEVAKFFLDKGEDVNEVNKNYFSPLRESLQSNKLNFTELFLERGATDFNYELGRLEENWRMALKLGSTKILKGMINNGLELNAEVHPAIMEEFVKSKNIELVEYALNSKNIIFSEKMQKKLMDIASINNDEKMLVLLKDKKTSPILKMTNERELKYLYEVKPEDNSIKHGRFKIINEDGYLESLGKYQNNLLEGQVLVFAVDSLATALGKESFPSVSNYKNGLLDGSKITYYDKEMKKIKTEEFYNKGKLNGTFNYFNESGFKCAELNFQDGLIHGALKEFMESNKIITDLVYKNGKIWSGFVCLKVNDDITKKFYDSYIPREYFSHENIVSKWVFDNGEIVKKAPYILKNGPNILIETGLVWLALAQEESGCWDPGKYEGISNDKMKILCTSLSLLSYLSQGYTDRAGQFKRQVKSSVRWLISVQKPNGSFTDDNSLNGICTMVLSEAVGMGVGDKEVKFSATRACNFILSQQNSSGGFNDFGSSKKLEPCESDKMIPTTWCIMGLKSAILSGLFEKEIQESFSKCRMLLEKVSGTSDSSVDSKGRAWFHGGGNDKESSKGGVCQGMALLVKQYLGSDSNNPWCVAATKELKLFYPKDEKSIDYVQSYFQHLTLFQALTGTSPNEFLKWSAKYEEMYTLAQSKDERFLYSWPKNSDREFSDGGRIVSTALTVLTLSIASRYRYLYSESIK